MRYHPATPLSLLLGLIIVSLLCACSNSEGVDYANYAEIADDNDVSSDGDYPQTQDASSSSKVIDYLPLDDSEYPYAGIPRIVIETEKFREIRDRETEIPAKMQIWGEKSPESKIMELTIRGRGNSSWLYMPKKSYKIEFINKQELLDMPKDRDWTLISNYADKSLMRNFIAYQLSAKLQTYYTPRCEFVELYLNREYLGVYLLTETIKVAKNRINIPKDDHSFIVEFDEKYRENEQIIFSDVIIANGIGKAFKIHEPKHASEQVLNVIQNHIWKFESFLKNNKRERDNILEEWIDVDDCIKHYWIQEFSKNPDAEFSTSVYFTWVEGEKIKMGPIWDFDLAFGNHTTNAKNFSELWFIRSKYWYGYFFKNKIYVEKSSQFWKQEHSLFDSVLNYIDVECRFLTNAAKNNYKRWNVLGNTTFGPWKNKKFNSYDEAVAELKEWITKRINWIDYQEGLSN